MMFLNHFKMTAHPFCERPGREQLLKDDRMAQGLARLEYLAEEGTIALLTGPTGVGKSSLLRLFIESLSPHRHQPLYVHLSHMPSCALLRLIVTALGERPRLGKDRLFLQILDKTHNSDRTTLLILDEAHLLVPDALTDLRLLVSSGLDAAPALKIVLSGQEPLQNLLGRASHADLVHRISVRHHLRPFTPEQTAGYIDFRLRSAGVSEKIFEPEAKRLIHDYAGGVPRQINNIATACLLNAAARNLQKVPEPLVNDTMAEFHLP
jgi:type II secretory pathway predicted ATPase ExeA